MERSYVLNAQRTATAEYPRTIPTKSELTNLCHLRLLCPGCSGQDIALGRCHATVLASKFNAVEAIGMQGVEEHRLEQTMHATDVRFVGRRPLRGMKRVWPAGMCGRSNLSNPFVVKKNNFSLAESLSLFKAYVDNDFQPLADDAVLAIVASVEPLPTDSQILRDTLEQSLRAYTSTPCSKRKAEE